MIFADEPIHPQKEWGNYGTYGLTKREYFAAKAMQGFISTYRGGTITDSAVIARRAVAIADALISELSNGENK